MKFITIFIYLKIIESIYSTLSPLEISNYQKKTLNENENLIEYFVENEFIILFNNIYNNNKIFGHICFSKNIQEKKDDIYYENYFESSNSTCHNLNSNNDFFISFNKTLYEKYGKGILYINIFGKMSGNIEIFPLNGIKNLNINENYFFPFINEFDLFTFKFNINNIEKNVYLHTFLESKNCINIELYKNNKKINCDLIFSSFYYLEKNNNYTLKYNYSSKNQLGINFLSNIVTVLDGKKQSFRTNKKESFYFIINTSLLQKFSIITSSIVCIYGGFVQNLVDLDKENNKINFSSEEYLELKQQIFIFEKTNNNYNYFYFIVSFPYLDNYNFSIQVITEIISLSSLLSNFPNSLNINMNKNSLLFFEENNDNNLIYKFSSQKKMKIIKNGKKSYYENNFFIFKLSKVQGLLFEDENNLKIDVVNQYKYKGNFIINDLLNNQGTYIINKNEKIFVNEVFDENLVYLNLICGDTIFYLVDKNNDLINNNEELTFPKLQKFINETYIVKIKSNSYSIYDYLIFNNLENEYYINYESKLIYFIKKIKYNIYLDEVEQLFIRILDGETILKYENDKIILNKTNNHFELIKKNSKIFSLYGNNSLIYFFIPLCINNYIIISNRDNLINNYRNVFLTFEKQNKDMIKIIISYINENKNDELMVEYIMDYNIIPYSRNKNSLSSIIYLKSNENYSLIIPNLLKNDKAKHFENEKFFIYFKLLKTELIRISYEYIDLNILPKKEPILISPGQNNYFLGTNDKNFIKIDKCMNNNITLSILRNNNNFINETKIDIEENMMIEIDRNANDNYISLNINNNKDFLLTLSEGKFQNNENLKNNYFLLSINKKNLNIKLNISSFLIQTEYYLFYIKKNEIVNFNNECFIFNLINNNTFLDVFYTSGTNNYFEKNITLLNDFKYDLNLYEFILIGKEYHTFYYSYIYFKQYLTNISNDDDENNNNEKEYKMPIYLILIIIFSIIIIFVLILVLIFIIKRAKRKNNLKSKIENIENKELFL